MNKKYQIIYADPPWRYATAPRWENTLSVEDHYRTMSVQDLMALDVPSIADKHCMLAIWVVMPLLAEQCIPLIKAWGFHYIGCLFNWVKTYNVQTEKPCLSLGHYTRGNTELCLLARKEAVPVLDHTISQILKTPREEHSKKPSICRQLLVQMFGDVPRIELFNREVEAGWDHLGIADGDIRENLPMKPIYNIKWKCDACGHEELFTIQGDTTFYCPHCETKYYINKDGTDASKC